MLSRRLVTIVAIGIGVAVIIGVIIAVVLMLNNSSNQQNGDSPNGPVITPQPQDPEEPEGPGQNTKTPDPHEEDNSGAFIQNIDPLYNYFSDTQTLFINDAVINYASDAFNSAQVYITDGYIKDNHDGTYGFDVNDGQKSLFYVIATKRPNDNVKVDFY